ncbi:MAG: hypothetical protein Q8S29_13900 [Phreatobacter sp.]|nr:hypothetical protein [Phreatobacter sp.]
MRHTQIASGMHGLLAFGAVLAVLGLAGGFIRATRPVDRHLKVVVHLVLPPAVAASL